MNPFVKFKNNIDGGETVSQTASLGLFHWYARTRPERPMPEELPPLVVVVKSGPVPGPYHSMFLQLVMWACERTHGNSPPIPDELLNHHPWYCSLPGNIFDFNTVVRLANEGNPKVVEYEQTCLNVLKWLAKKGDLAKLEYERV